MAARGLDPAMEAARERAATFASVCEDYFAEEVRKKHRRAKRTEAEIRRMLVSEWGGRPQDVMALVRAEVRRGHPTSAHHALGHAKSVLRWAFHEGSRYGLTSNVAAAVTPTAVVGTSRAMRQRVLTDAELRGLWRAAEEMGFPYGVCVKIMMLTGCRRTEVLRHALERGRHYIGGSGQYRRSGSSRGVSTASR